MAFDFSVGIAVESIGTIVVKGESLEQSNGFYIILSENKSSEMFTSTVFGSGRKSLRNMSSF